MLTGNTQFEFELKKIIDVEIDRIKDILADGSGVTDYAAYRNYVGQIYALRRTAHNYCDDVVTKMNER